MKYCTLLVFVITTSWCEGNHKDSSQDIHQEMNSFITRHAQEHPHDKQEHATNIVVGKSEQNLDSLINVVFTFKDAAQNINLQDKFRTTVTSMLALSKSSLQLFIIGESESQDIARAIITNTVKENHISTRFLIASLDVDEMAQDLHHVVEPMQRYFSYRPGAYYSDALFFLSIAIHHFMPAHIDRVIMLDADLLFKSDITLLHDHFQHFKVMNVMGIARENQPVYRHSFSAYRRNNPGTGVGEPPPDGLTGFNSGVLLLDLSAMRHSNLYNSLLNEETLKQLTLKYQFKGHLGDQDFFSLISMEYSDLFYILPCGWNRQLCTWWKNNGYESVFASYFDCKKHIHIFHGNCNTAIPKD